ncbi:type I-F CRISPR-associated helicase Cas3f [Maridesulfovibrio bastinii]|uniref:type I-F CRISPR-associated helicase Cas3f n=1 Tax=Maridesulfovibrio bastinii TaxID=47157 RepID=UPI0006874C69|nr:type I-F CRISPR-associated helicase Cas3f [Maridesulfovibrio bastinii]
MPNMKDISPSFNEQGAVPTNITYSNVLRKDDENTWNSLESIRLLTVLAALLHDSGKASIHFQEKLKKSARIADPYRHEWVSLRIFQNFVAGREDIEWLSDLAEGRFGSLWQFDDSLIMDGISKKAKSPFKKMDRIASFVGWLMVSHHRMPAPASDSGELKIPQLKKLPSKISADWAGSLKDADDIPLTKNWEFTLNPFDNPLWEKQAIKAAARIVARQDIFDNKWLDDSFAIHISRMALIMADHFYSSLTDRSQRIVAQDRGLFANTARGADGHSCLNQGLAEHLVGVAAKSSLFLHALPRLRDHLPGIGRHKGFTRRAAIKQFQWQNKCYDLAASIAQRSVENGFFGINMASTGCGKTFANGRIMYGIGDSPHGVRFTYALGLRTLTLQTGSAYRKMLSLGDDELAVLVGGGAVRRLHELRERPAQNGCESAAPQQQNDFFLDENSHVFYEGNVDSSVLSGWFDNNLQAKKLITSPITVCTIDHLMPGTESLRGGHHIPPMLRLLTSDLILDEPDDFSLADLHGLSRLVNWAGMLGSRVLLSSATMPPAFIEGLFDAYAAGRKVFMKNCGSSVKTLPVCCAWFDEFNAVAHDMDSGKNFIEEHNSFVEKRCEKISATEQRKRGKIVAVDTECESTEADVAATILKYSSELHSRHFCSPSDSSVKVSFGLVRMANINSAVNVAKELSCRRAPEGVRVHICCYHSQYPLMVRSAIEKRLDAILKRENDQSIFENEYVIETLKKSDLDSHIFIVLATPVAEVGRDHDYDWAIIEPSSMRSIVQLAGRVWRHRKDKVCNYPNIYILEKNIKALKGKEVVFEKPGFESKWHKLSSHDLHYVLTEDQYREINSLPRIKERSNFDETGNLVDLEHFQIRNTMTSRKVADDDETEGADRWWNTRASLSGYLQKTTGFRSGEKNNRYSCVLEDEYEEIKFIGFNDVGEEIDCDYLFRKEDFEPDSESISFWDGSDFKEVALKLADDLDMDIEKCSRIFGQFALRASGEEKGWKYHPNLGFYS